MTTVAEGVDEQHQVDFLAAEGCNMIQGYYYSKPMPKEEYEARMGMPAQVEIAVPEQEETVVPDQVEAVVPTNEEKTVAEQAEADVPADEQPEQSVDDPAGLENYGENI